MIGLGESSIVGYLLSEIALTVLVFVLAWRLSRLRRQHEQLLAEKELIYNFVYDIGEVFVEAETVDPNPILDRVLSCALRSAHGGAGAIYLREADGQTFRAAAVAGIFPPLVGGADEALDKAFSKVRHVEALVRGQPAHVGEGLIGEVIARGQSLLIEDGDSDDRVPVFNHDFLRLKTLLAVPMRFQHNVIGVVVLVNRADGGTFTMTDAALLQAMADQAAVVVHYATVSMALDEKRRLDHDLTTARDIQTALLPNTIPHMSGLDIAAFSLSAQQIGGDFYEFVEIDDHRIGFAIADVSGKGVAGALMMSICRTVLRVSAPDTERPSDVLREVNRIVCEDIGEDMFISMLYMILDTQSRKLTVARAGHLPALVCPPSPEEAWEASSEGIAVGLAGTQLFDQALADNTVQLSEGDTVVIYTDGVTEAQDVHRNEWGVLNLAKTVQVARTDGDDAEHVAGAVRQKLLQFVGNVPQYDDMTLVAICLDLHT